eukprot:1400972-Prymnesium_polylepis.1
MARAQVVALIEQLENRMNAMGQGGALLAMVKQKTMSKCVQPQKTTPFDNVAGQMRKMSAQLKVIVTPADLSTCMHTPCPAPASLDCLWSLLAVSCLEPRRVLQEGVGNASVIPFPSTREAAYASAHPNPAPAKGDESNGDAPTLQPDLTVEPITPIREESERQR